MSSSARSPRFVPRAASAALTVLFAAAPALAQIYPWVGLSSLDADLFAEAGIGIDGPNAADHFGFSVAAGDFNGDGVDDLATGVPFNDCDATVPDCGSVVVRYGLPGSGLQSAFFVLRQPGIDLPDGAERNEQYGYALAAGDLNGDGFDELAIGTPGNVAQGVENRIPTGAVDVRFGYAGGLTDWSVEYVPGRFGLPGGISYLSRFGAAVAFGDFDGDGRDDIAVGAPDDGVPCEPFGCRGGSVLVFGMDAEGSTGGYFMVLGDQGLPDAAEEGEKFGHSLAAGDFNGDGYDDLAVGTPFEDDTGAVLVVYGSPWSLLFAEHRYIGQWDLGEPAEQGDHFGDALAAGDFDGDGYDDLVISSSHEDGDGGVPENTGLAIVNYGSPDGLASRSSRLWQDELFWAGESEPHDYFGSAFAVGDFDADGIDDLAIGHEGENNGVTDSGAVSVVLGTPLGLFGERRKLRPGDGAAGVIPDSESGHPFYGFALAAGDFDGSGHSDLAIGGPNRDVAPIVDTGGVAVLYGSLFASGFEVGAGGEWSGLRP